MVKVVASNADDRKNGSLGVLGRDRKLGYLVDKSAGLVIERLRVPIPAGTAAEFSSPELTL